ncbi:MAG TPA: TadE/TadG family type IV pilus assembly protein [Jatrophihabitantaceae bacterium]|jgi:Flp pilus assembly protein TadG
MSTLARRVRVRLRSLDRQQGFATLELVIMIPVFVIVVLLVVGFGRVTHAKQLVEQAASAAARAATLQSNPTAAATAAQQEAQSTLSGAGISCGSFSADVNTADFRPGGEVTVSVRCTASLADLVTAGFPGSKTLTATSSSPLEQLRQYDGGGG